MTKSEEEKGFKVTDKRRVTLNGLDIGAPKEEAPPKINHDLKEEDAGSKKIDFSTFILSLGGSALIFLGDVEDPIRREKTQELNQAKEIIDLLGMLEEKTKGNLNKEEENILANLLFDLRMRYVEKSRKSSSQG